MELVKFDDATKRFVIRMPPDEFGDTVAVLKGVYKTAERQDFTALGVYTKERVLELVDALEKNNTTLDNITLEQQDFLDLFDLVGGVCATAGMQDFTALAVTKERASDLSKELRNVLRKDLNKEPI